MTHHFHKLKEKFRYRLKTGHHKGHGIHSPYLYRFVTAVIQEKLPYYCFGQIEKRKDDQTEVSTSAKKRFRYRSYFKKEKSKEYYGQLIFRIIQDAQFHNVLELGTASGMETLYMALANREATCVSVTSSDKTAELAKKVFQEHEGIHIQLHELRSGESVQTVLDWFDGLDFVLFNQTKSENELLDWFNLCLPKKKNNSIFVFMNIRKNPEATKSWKKIRTNPQSQVSIDLFNLGIVLFNPELEKKNYVLQTK